MYLKNQPNAIYNKVFVEYSITKILFKRILKVSLKMSIKKFLSD